MLPPHRELEFLKFLEKLSAHLKAMQDPHKALLHALRDTREFFQATYGCVAVLEPGQTEADLLFTLPKEGDWDRLLLGRFIRHRYPPIRSDLMMGPLRRRGGAWATMALMRQGHVYDRHDRELLTRVTAAITKAIRLMDRERLMWVRDRIDRKIMEEIHPKDLFYQILDGLRSLTHYDHSSALLIHEDAEGVLRLVAEQIAWTKAKSHRIGLELPVDSSLRGMLDAGQTYGFDRRGDGWREWSGKPVAGLAELLDYHGRGPAEGEGLREGAMLCAPLVTRDGIVGVLKVAARHPGKLTMFDAELVERFRSQAAVAIQNLHRTESLQARMLTAERKHAMAELARTVAHDVNNALGSMLPLIQQMQDDLRQGRLEANVHLDDLDQVHKSLQACRRIFGGMLSFARGGARRAGHGQVRPALETVLAILKDGMERRGIDLAVEMPADLPPVACGQSDLEQVFLNLLTNAREASAERGNVTVRVQPAQDRLDITIADTGRGIAPEHLQKVFEPFFSTKANGNGLGLSICRSILWEIGGTVNVHSEAGKGTRVHVGVPWASTLHEPDPSTPASRRAGSR
jgi:two-component system NtrC family sensor kinase